MFRSPSLSQSSLLRCLQNSSSAAYTTFNCVEISWIRAESSVGLDSAALSSFFLCWIVFMLFLCWVRFQSEIALLAEASFSVTDATGTSCQASVTTFLASSFLHNRRSYRNIPLLRLSPLLNKETRGLWSEPSNSK